MAKNEAVDNMDDLGRSTDVASEKQKRLNKFLEQYISDQYESYDLAKKFEQSINKASNRLRELQGMEERLLKTKKEQISYVSQQHGIVTDLARKESRQLGEMRAKGKEVNRLTFDKINAARELANIESTVTQSYEDQQDLARRIESARRSGNREEQQNLERLQREEIGRYNNYLRQRDVARGVLLTKKEELGTAIMSAKSAASLVRETQKNLKTEKTTLSTLEEGLEVKEKQLRVNRRTQEALKKMLPPLESAAKITRTIDRLLGESAEEYKKIKKLVMDIAQGGATAWLALIQASLERWKELDKAAGDFRDKTGLLISQTKELDKAAREVNVQMAYIGVGLQEAYETAGALTQQFQVVGLVTKDMVADTAQMAANLGISVQDSAKIRGLFTSIAKSSGMTATQMIGATAKLAEMGGVAPAAVMKDIAEASEDTLKFIGKSPIALMAAAVEARRLGTTINSITKSARGFLNFQDSITSELTASAMVGRSLNFQAARRAAWEKDALKSRQLAMKEINKLGDFNKLNILQQEEIAKAAHMTVEEIIQQQNQEKMLAALQRERPGMYREYMEMQRKVREDQEAAKKDLVKQGEEFVKNQNRQREMTKLANAFKQVWTDITDALLPIANVIMPIIITAIRLLVFPIKLIAALVRGLLKPFDIIGNSLRSGNSSAMSLEKAMVGIAKFTEKATGWMEKLGELLGFLFKAFLLIQLVQGRLVFFGEKFKLQTKALSEYIKIGSGYFRRVYENVLNVGRALLGMFPSTQKIVSFFTKISTLTLSVLVSTKQIITQSRYWLGMLELIRKSAQGILGTFRFIRDIVFLIGNGIGKIITNTRAWAWVTGNISKLFGKIVAGYTIVKSFLSSMFGGIAPKVAEFFGSIARRASGLINFFKPLASAIGGLFMAIFGPLKNLTQLITSPFKALKSIFGGIGAAGGVIGKIFGTIAQIAPKFAAFFKVGFKAIPIFGQILMAVEAIWKMGGKLMDIWSSDMNIGEKLFNTILAIPQVLWDVVAQPFVDIAGWILDSIWPGVGKGLVDGISSIGTFVLDALKWPFKKMFGWFKSDSELAGQSPSGLGLMIVDGVKSIATMLFDALTSPFKMVMNFVSGLFGGNGDLGTTIVSGIKNIGGAIFDVLTWPFRKLMDFASKIPIIGRFFGGGDASKAAFEAKSNVENTISQSVEIRNMDELRESIDKLTAAIAALGGAAGGATPVVNVNNNAEAMVAKLDELIKLMTGGAIAVNIDGALASKALARAST